MRSLRLIALFVVLVPQASAQLSGNYTINGAVPTAGGNYQTIAEALADLHSQTLVGPVTYQMFDDGGPWTETNPVLTFVNSGTAPLSIQGFAIVGASPVNTVTFEAAPGEAPVLDAAGQDFGVFMHGTQYCTVKGLEVVNAISDGVSIYTDAISTPITSVTGNLMGNRVLGCRIHDIGGCGINVYQNGGALIAFESTVIRNNFIWTCQVTHGGGNNTWRNGYINERRSINAVIEHNTCYADTGVGPNFGIYCTDYAAPTGGPAASFRNNLLIKTVANGSVLRHLDPASTPIVQDFNAYDDVSGGMLLFGLSGTAANLASLQAAYPALEQNGVSGPSVLVNPLSGDLHLSTGSIAIDLGVPISGVTTDIDGELRPLGLGVDIGADELTANTPQVNLYGAGCPGANGTPNISSAGLPFIGNAAFSIDFINAPPMADTFLFAALGRQLPAIPIGSGCNLHLELASFQSPVNSSFGPFGPNPASPTGTFTYLFSIPNTPSLAGSIITLQGAATDPSIALGFTLTNGLEVVLY